MSNKVFDNETYEQQRINIELLQSGTRFKGMEIGKEYTCEELGL